MKTSRFFAAFCLIACVSGSLRAQTTIPSNDVTENYWWGTHDIEFVTDADGDGTFVTENQLAGMDNIDVALPSGGTMNAWAMCSEFHVGPIDGPYQMYDGFGPLGATEEANIRALISNAYPLFDAARNSGTWDEASTYASAMQIVLWEIIDDTNQQLVIDSTDPLAGVFQVNLDHPSSDANTEGALIQAEAFLSNIRSGAWTDQGGINYYYVDASPNQDRFWFAPETVPEPDAIALVLIGLALGLRRRR
jgi:hypothetical protein